jgi:O-antigen/teichoic acid export membrane protein
LKNQEKKSRTSRSAANAIASLANFILLLPTQFVLRYLISKHFGVSYMGLTGLFTSILNVLSLADLGIGASISYALYRPIADNNHNLINALMRLYKKIYISIGMFIVAVGVCMTPFLGAIVGRGYSYGNMYLIFALMLLNVAVSYFFAYNQSLLIADQRNDVILWTGIISGLATLIGEIIAINVTNSVYLYLVVPIVVQLVYNVLLSRFVRQRYQLKNTKNLIPKPVIRDLISNTIGNGLSRISGVVVTSSDNIMISMFVGLKSVGSYTNYTLIITVLQKLLMQVFNSIQASIGSFGVNKAREDGASLYRRLQLVNFVLVLVIGCGFISVINPIIYLWLGPKYLLGKSTIILMTISFYFMNYQVVSWNFTAAYGLASKMKIVPILESVVNILASLIFLMIFKMGINGVILGTIVSTIVTVGWQRPYIIYRHGFGVTFMHFVRPFLKDTVVFFISLIFVGLMDIVLYVGNPLLELFAKGFLSVIISIGLVILFYWKDRDFIFLRQMGLHLIRR